MLYLSSLYIYASSRAEESLRCITIIYVYWNILVTTPNKSKPIKCFAFSRQYTYLFEYLICCTRKIVHYDGDVLYAKPMPVKPRIWNGTRFSKTFQKTQPHIILHEKHLDSWMLCKYYNHIMCKYCIMILYTRVISTTDVHFKRRTLTYNKFILYLVYSVPTTVV